MRRIVGGMIGFVCSIYLPVQSYAQTSPSDSATTPLSSRWEVSVDGQVGVPSGYVKVGETNSPGTRLRLRSDLGIDVSEAVDANVSFRFTPRDAIRAALLYYFLDGRTTINRPFNYNGPTFAPGHLNSTLDFYRLSLSYDRRLLAVVSGGALTGSVGLTYVSLDAVVHGNHEDFYRQELPVPIAGAHLDYPLHDRVGVIVSLSGGTLPRVDSLRKEGGTVYLEQSHADAGLGLTYALSRALQVRAGYHFTYFFQYEKSHEDNNAFELIDNGFRAGLTLRF